MHGMSRAATTWLDMPGWRLLLPLVFFALIVLISPSWGAAAPWVFFVLAALILVREDVQRNAASGEDEDGNGYISLGDSAEGIDSTERAAGEGRHAAEEERERAEGGRRVAEEERQRVEGERRVAEEERLRAEDERCTAEDERSRAYSHAAQPGNERSEASPEESSWQLPGGDDGLEFRGMHVDLRRPILLQPRGCLILGHNIDCARQTRTLEGEGERLNETVLLANLQTGLREEFPMVIYADAVWLSCSFSWCPHAGHEHFLAIHIKTIIGGSVSIWNLKTRLLHLRLNGSIDFQWCCVGDRFAVSASRVQSPDQCHTFAYDLETGAVLRDVESSGVFSHDGSKLASFKSASGRADGKLRVHGAFPGVITLSSGETGLHRFKYGCIAWRPHTEQVVAQIETATGGHICCWDLANLNTAGGTPVLWTAPVRKSSTNIDFSPDGSRLHVRLDGIFDILLILNADDGKVLLDGPGTFIGWDADGKSPLSIEEVKSPVPGLVPGHVSTYLHRIRPIRL